METADLTSDAYWEDGTPDLRGNPAGPEIGRDLVDFVSAEPRLQGHVLMATSGSEGFPKWIALSKRALRASAEAVNGHLETTPEDRWLCALPTYHVGGFGVHARAFFGGNQVTSFEGRWRGRAEEFASRCRREGITLTTLTPTQLHDLVAEEVRAPESLRAVVVGGGRLAPEIGGAARRLGWPVLASFGMTETASQVATEPLAALRLPYSGVWLRVLAAWNVDRSEDGRLLVKGEALFSGRVERRPTGALHFEPATPDPAGWFETRDRVEISLRPDGNVDLKHLGRVDDQVKKLGELVALDDLRAMLEGMLGERRQDAALLAMPDDRLDHRLVVAVERGREDHGEIEARVADFNARVLPYQRIDEVVRVDVLPRTSLGKIAWAELKRRLSG